MQSTLNNRIARLFFNSRTQPSRISTHFGLLSALPAVPVRFRTKLIIFSSKIIRSETTIVRDCERLRSRNVTNGHFFQSFFRFRYVLVPEKNTLHNPSPRFLPLDSPFARTPNPTHPPLFAAILRRTTGIKVLECHAFICKREVAANALVRCCFHAYADSSYAKQVDNAGSLYGTLVSEKNSKEKVNLFKRSRLRDVGRQTIFCFVTYFILTRNSCYCRSCFFFFVWLVGRRLET